MIIADLYIEKNGYMSEKPKTVLIWRVYARTDFEVARLLKNHISDETIVQGIIRRAHLEDRICLKYRKTVTKHVQYENWMVLTNNLAEVNKIYMEMSGIQDVIPSYGLEDAIDITTFK